MPNNKKGKKKQPEESQADRTRREQAAAKKNADEMALLEKELAEKAKVMNQTKALSEHIHKYELPEFKAMPKIELHAHLSGSLSPGTISRILGDKEKCVQVLKKYRLRKPEGMKRVFECFPAVNEVLERPEHLKLATIETCREFCDDGCVYLELRSTPKRTPYMNIDVYLRSVVEGIIEARKMFPQMKIFFIVGINRSMNYDSAAQILHVTGILQLESNVIVALELSGDPRVYAGHLIPIFQVARRFHGLGITVHLAETKEYTEDTTDWLNLMPDRVGHGTFLHTNKKFVEIMTYYNIPIEFCLSSNLFTKTITSPIDSHFQFWKRRGNPVSINTDDKGIFPAASLSEEYYKVAKTFNLSMEELITLNFNALRTSFGFKYSCTTFLDTFQKIGENTLN